MRPDRVADACWAAALVTLPMAGVGLVRAMTGHDLGAGLQPAYLAVALAWAVRTVRLISPDRRRGLRDALADPAARPGWVALAALVGAVAVSALGLWVAPAPVVAGEAWPRFARQFVQLVAMIAFTVHAWLWTRGERRWRITGTCLTAGLAIEVVYAALQAWHAAGGAPWLAGCESIATSNPAILSGSGHLYLGGFTAIPRLRGSMCEPLYLGSYLVGVVPLLIALGRGRWAAAALVVLVGTWSRGAWGALALAGGLWLVLQRRGRLAGPSRRWWAFAVVVAVLVVAGVLAVGGPGALALPARRFAQTLDAGDWSNLTRLYSAQAAWRTFLQSPVVGVGWGQFPYHFYALVDVTGLHSQFQWPVVNSIPLLVLCETGVVGAGAGAAMLAAGARATWRALSHADAVRVRRLVGASVAVAGVAVHLLVFSQYNLPHLWVVPGLWLATLAEARRGPGDRLEEPA